MPAALTGGSRAGSPALRAWLSDLREHDYFIVFVVETPARPTPPIRRRRAHPRLEDQQWLTKHYIERGRSSADVAAELGVTAVTVRHALRAAGIPLRPRGRPTRTLDGADAEW